MAAARDDEPLFVTLLLNQNPGQGHDELYTEHPFPGSRKIARLLAREGVEVSRHTIRRYRAEMGLETIYAKPNLSVPAGAEHRVYPYLLRNLTVERVNQVWGVDITYIRLVGGWMYLDAILV